MTFRQTQELGAHVRKGEKGYLVVYANTITKTETDEVTGEEEEREIPFMKGYTVFNVEQIEGLPANYYALAEPRLDPVQRIEHAESFFAGTGADVRHGGNRAYYSVTDDRVQMPPFETFRDVEPITPRWRMNARTGRGTLRAWTVTLAGRNEGMKATPWRNWLRNWARLSCRLTWT